MNRRQAGDSRSCGNGSTLNRFRRARSAGRPLRGLETFANPGVSHVEMTSDELTAVCPVTGQLDLYVAYERVLAGRPLHRVEACGLRKRDPAANAQVRAHDGLLAADARTPRSSLRTLREPVRHGLGGWPAEADR